MAHLAQVIELDPTYKQAEYFRRACGTARFAWNWALAEWKRMYEAGEKPDWMKLNKAFNSWKKVHAKWCYEVTKHSPAEAIVNLGEAFKRFFKKLAKYPKFKKKGVKDSFCTDNGGTQTKITDRYAILPKIGRVRLKHAPRFAFSKVCYVTVKREADRWFLVVTGEVEIAPTFPKNQGVVGVDLGLKTMATCSDGTEFESPKPLKRFLRRLKRLQRRKDRKVKGSRNRQKARVWVAKLHRRIRNIRKDCTHKMTKTLIDRYQTIVIEDLNVRGMAKNEKLARAVSDVGFYEIRRQLEYKAKLYGREIVVADRFFPSSKMCCKCGAIREELLLSEREFRCDCGNVMDRDLNAAINLSRVGPSRPEFTPAEIGSQVAAKAKAGAGRRSRNRKVAVK